MDASIFGEFGVEGGSHGSSLPNGDGVGAFGGENLDSFSDMRDLWSADENHFQWGFFKFAPEIADKLALADGAIDLASIGVAPDADVERAESRLGGVFDFLGEKDGTGAGAESWFEENELLEF